MSTLNSFFLTINLDFMMCFVFMMQLVSFLSFVFERDGHFMNFVRTF